MNNIGRISKAQFLESLLHGLVIVGATFAVGFFGALDQVDFFANLTSDAAITALRDAVNSTWHLFYAAVIPFLVNLTRWDKK